MGRQCFHASHSANRHRVIPRRNQGMNATIENLFKEHDLVTINEIMAYFSIARSTVRNKMKAAGLPVRRNGGKHLLTREQVRRLFPDTQ